MKDLKKLLAVALVLPALVFTSNIALAADVDHSIYNQLLQKYVHGHRVDYSGFQREETVLDQYLDQLSATDPATLTRNQAMAFYINTYNAFTIKLILTQYPDLNSIKELGGFFSGPWSKEFIPLNGRTVTLDYIEHEVLRPRYKDPRIHFAVNCASKGCPPLRNSAYTGADLERQLDEQTIAFINTPDRTHFKDNTLYVSKIFDWFGEDFNDNPEAFVRQYAQGELKRALDGAVGRIKVSYLSYDWTLNR